MAMVPMQTGTVLKNNGSFGFIQQDFSEENMFVLPQSCVAFGNNIPPLGTRIMYEVVVDAKTGRPRAENVGMEMGAELALQQEMLDVSGLGLAFGTVLKNNGVFGFIQQDASQENMFVMPGACGAFGGCIPPAGFRVAYHIVTDEKTGRLRAEGVQPEEVAMAAQAMAGGPVGPHPWSVPEQEFWQGMEASGGTVVPVPASTGDGTSACGTILKSSGSGNYGFIQQDSGEENMFVMPRACPDFGSVIPPPGTRVMYEVVVDAKTRRARAEGVRPEPRAQPSARKSVPSAAMAWPAPWSGPPRSAWGSSRWANTAMMPQWKEEETHSAAPSMQAHYRPGASPIVHGERAGTISKSGPSFGFIEQDCGEDGMFVMPKACAAFNGTIPPVGTRVIYDVVVDGKTGRSRAEDLRPEPASHIGSSGELAGTMLKNNSKFGFIQQDSNEENMFVMPQACGAFGYVLPQPGARVVYEVVTDQQTGRPRADNVRPEPDIAFAAGKRPVVVRGPKKEFAFRNTPYGIY